jgi:hypothetical protein
MRKPTKAPSHMFPMLSHSFFYVSVTNIKDFPSALVARATSANVLL